MRTVRIENYEYETYEAIRDVLIETVPFAVINDMYSSKLKKAIFNFWDSDYIPENLQDKIMQPPTSRENKDLMRSKISEVNLLRIDLAFQSDEERFFTQTSLYSVSEM